MKHAPTDEQRQALALFSMGATFAIEAGAGTGKTTTLQLLAESAPNRRGQYVAFNKAIVTESRSKFPQTVACNTAHSLAFKAVGRHFSHRLNAGRMRSGEIARRLGLGPINVKVGDKTKVLQPAKLGSLVMATISRFCQTADLEPTAHHVPFLAGIDMPREDGTMSYANNDLVSRTLAPVLAKAWADLMDPQGQLPYKHEHYLKAWQLSDPKIDADYILFDEAQDASPVMLAAVKAQTHAQLVFVGDSAQQIYEFTGAVNALAQVGTDERTYLSQSFRFGAAVADVANDILAKLDTPLELRGFDQILSRVEPIDGHPDAILTRCNATAVSKVLELQAAGVPVHLVGGGAEVLAFSRGVVDLRTKGSSTHPDLQCFDSWAEVVDYVDQDPQGGELKLLVDLVEEFGTDVIEAALGRMATEANAKVIVSTAHKAKGREWERVQLAADFAGRTRRRNGDDDESELRLLYVAVTRAKVILDISAIPSITEDVEPQVSLWDEAAAYAATEWIDGPRS